MRISKLKPCPFCGSKQIILDCWEGIHGMNYYVLCKKCRITLCSSDGFMVRNFQAWGETPVMLCGEGYGVKIQGCGARYIPDGVNFRLFDVFIPSQNLWLRRAGVEGVAQTFGVECAPVVATGMLMELVAYVKCRPCSQIAADRSLPMEGVVARPAVELKNRRGGRVIVKIKARDFA